MEPERKIEKLLRAYAKKRRAQAGDPLKLHPATRRLLQAEIARNASKPDTEDESLSLWELFHQQWAFLVGFALVVFFVATLVLPSLSKAKFKSQQAATRYHLMEIGTAVRMYADDNREQLPASLDELTNELHLDLPNTILVDPQNGQRFVYVAGGKRLNNLESNSILAYSSADKKGRAVLFADGRVEVMKGARFSELTNRGLPQLVAMNNDLVRQRAEAPATLTVASGNAAAAPGFSGRLETENNRDESKLANSGIAPTSTGERAASPPATPAETIDQPALQHVFQNTARLAKAIPVLLNFQVQQSGSAVRVVDADGSVYDGALQPASTIAQNKPAPADMPASEVAPSQIQNKEVRTGISAQLAAQNYFFRVTGMNRTLKQNVVFSGNLLAISSLTTNAPQAFGKDGGTDGIELQSTVTNQLLWSNSRIAGTAVIADTNKIEINAVPLSP